MVSVGKMLVTLRGKRGKTVEEIAALTRIPRSSLLALEAEQFDTLPAPVYVKGFIRAYCQALGVDASEVVRAYEALLFQDTPADSTASLLVVGSAEPARPAPVHSRLKLAHALLLVVAAITFLIALLTSNNSKDGRQVASTRPAGSTASGVDANTDSGSSSTAR